MSVSIEGLLPLPTMLLVLSNKLLECVGPDVQLVDQQEAWSLFQTAAYNHCEPLHKAIRTIYKQTNRDEDPNDTLEKHKKRQFLYFVERIHVYRALVEQVRESNE